MDYWKVLIVSCSRCKRKKCVHIVQRYPGIYNEQIHKENIPNHKKPINYIEQ